MHRRAETREQCLCVGALDGVPSTEHSRRRNLVAHRMLPRALGAISDGVAEQAGLGHDVLTAADDGKLLHRECPPLMVDYVAPSPDTTISTISSALQLFAVSPEQWTTNVGCQQHHSAPR